MVFSEPRRAGHILLLRQQKADFRNDNFNDRVNSIEVKGTCKWIFYTHMNFQGPLIVLGPRVYNSPSEFEKEGGILSSARALPPDTRSALVLFEGLHFTGRMVVVYQSEPTAIYRLHNFNDRAQSAIITGTPSWTLFFHGEYRGEETTLRRGYYPTLPDSVTGEVSSVRMNGDLMMQEVESILESNWNE